MKFITTDLPVCPVVPGLLVEVEEVPCNSCLLRSINGTTKRGILSLEGTIIGIGNRSKRLSTLMSRGQETGRGQNKKRRTQYERLFGTDVDHGIFPKSVASHG